MYLGSLQKVLFKMGKNSVSICFQLLCSLSFVVGNVENDDLKEVPWRVRYPSSDKTIANGDGSYIHPYNGSCDQLSDSVFLPVTFPGHVEMETGSQIEILGPSVEDVYEFVVQAFEYVPKDLDNVYSEMLNIMLPILNHLTNENQQAEALKQYGTDSASNYFRTLRDKVIPLNIIVKTLLAHNMRVQRDEIKSHLLPTALKICSEILELFVDDGNFGFRKHALLSAPYLFSFAGLYFTVAHIALAEDDKEEIPDFNYNYLNRLSSIIDFYKDSVIEERQNRVNVVYWSLQCNFIPTPSCYNPRVEDTVPERIVTPRDIVFSSNFKPEEAKGCYKQAIRMKYQSLFTSVAKCLIDVAHNQSKSKARNILFTNKKPEPSGLSRDATIFIVALVISILLLGAFYLLIFKYHKASKRPHFNIEESLELNE